MPNNIALLILLGSFVVLLIIRMPIAFAIGVSTLVTILCLGLPLQIVAQNMVKGINVFVLLAVPFFILAGEIMGAGGISNRLIKLSSSLVGHYKGGLASVNILASMFFGGISGSSAADASSIGSILIPMMKKQGYDGDFATTVTMAGSVQGILIPPSHNMVIYAMAAGGVSIGQLFLAGFAPGIALGLALMVFSLFVSVRRKYPVGKKFTFKEKINAIGESFLGIFTIVIVVGGVVSGIFTATESAAIATVYAFVVTFFVYREIPLSKMGEILGRSVRTLAIIFILIATSSAFGWLLAYLRVPSMIASGILSITASNKILVLLVLNLIMLFLGMIMDMSSIILITTPILLPIALKVGVDPVHFGIIMMLNLGIGLLTPPVGGTLFIGSAISGISMEKLTKAMLPFYAVMIAVLIFITYVPEFTLFVPHLLMK